jgi:hypothetical protein
MIGVFSVDCNKDVIFYPIFLKQAKPLHYLIEGSLPFFVHSVSVMYFLRAVKANSYKKGIFFKKLTPLVIKKRTVSLYRIFKNHAWLSIFFLELKSVSIKINSHESGLAPLPAKSYLLATVCVNKLSCIILQNFI